MRTFSRCWISCSNALAFAIKTALDLGEFEDSKAKARKTETVLVLYNASQAALCVAASLARC
jgi:hypothetical protein